MQNTEKTLFKKLMDFTYVFLMVIADCSGVSGSPGVYSIQVDPDNSVQAACLEGGWTVIQSRGFLGIHQTILLKDGLNTKLVLECLVGRKIQIHLKSHYPVYKNYFIHRQGTLVRLG